MSNPSATVNHTTSTSTLNASAPSFSPQGTISLNIRCLKGINCVKPSSKCRVMETIQEPSCLEDNKFDIMTQSIDQSPSNNILCKNHNSISSHNNHNTNKSISHNTNKNTKSNVSLKSGKLAKQIPTKLRGPVSVPKEFTKTIIPQTINEDIHDVYDYMDKAMAFPNNKLVSDDRCLIIINFDFHEKKSKEELFCIILRKTTGKRKWRMIDQLFTAGMIANKYEISQDKLPKSANQQPGIHLHHIHELSYIIDAVENELYATKWQKVPVYDKPNNKQSHILRITTREFAHKLKQALKNSEIIRWFNVLHADDLQLVASMMIVHLTEEISIGISFHLERAAPCKGEAPKVQITGIHLDKDQILVNHQLASTDHDCHCLDNFKSNINDLQIGNIKDEENKIKALKKENRKLRDENKNPIIKYIKEILDGVSDLISNDMKTAILSIEKIFNIDTIKAAIENCLKSKQFTKKAQQQKYEDTLMVLQTMDANVSITNTITTPMSYLTTICGTYATTTILPPMNGIT